MWGIEILKPLADAISDIYADPGFRPR